MDDNQKKIRELEEQLQATLMLCHSTFILLKNVIEGIEENPFKPKFPKYSQNDVYQLERRFDKIIHK